MKADITAGVDLHGGPGRGPLPAFDKGEVKLLLVRNVDVRYDNVQVLFGVDFEIDEGEIVALLGTNGAGKSTLLKAIAAWSPPTAGRSCSTGATPPTPPHEIAGAASSGPGRTGRVPVADRGREPAAGGWLIVTRAARGGWSARCSRIFPSLEDRIHEPAANLSGGQQQMLTLGMAFLVAPAC